MTKENKNTSTNRNLAVDGKVHHEYKKLAAYLDTTSKELAAEGLRLLKEKYNYHGYGDGKDT